LVESTTRVAKANLTPTVQIEGEKLLALGRDSSADALDELRRYSPEELAAALQQLPVAKRAEFLETADRVDEIVPLLPVGEFTATVRGAGIEENGWLVAYASSEQRIAAVDLDCWRDFRFSPSRLLEWIDAMIEAGPETLAASFDELDPELWVLAMRSMGDFSAFGVGTLDPTEATTEDGAVFYAPYTSEDELRIREILTTALLYAPSHYLWLVQAAISESSREAEQLAARWQRSRLGDLGFPERDQAMRVYQPLRVDEAPIVDVGEGSETELARTPSSQLPQELDGSLVGRALTELPPQRAHEIMGNVLAVANAIAVADKLPLSEPETVAQSLAKALRGMDRGLAELARTRRQALGVILDATAPRDLFRIGATVDAELMPRATLQDLLQEEDASDWNIEVEMIDPADQTLGSDGRPR
jgi:hypothetical protein